MFEVEGRRVIRRAPKLLSASIWTLTSNICFSLRSWEQTWWGHWPSPVTFIPTCPVLDLAWPALESMTWNICSILQQLFEKLPEFCAWWVIRRRLLEASHSSGIPHSSAIPNSSGIPKSPPLRHINNVVESFKILDFLLTKYQKIISSCYFGKFRAIFVPIEKHHINFLKNC